MNPNSQITNDELDKELGINSYGTSYRTITVDNGVDIAGTGATGDFVEKSFDEDSKKIIRTPFSDNFSGVILAIKALVTDKGKKKSWVTAEFNPSAVDELIPVYSLVEGKTQKDINGNTVVHWGTYNDLKKRQSVAKPDGTIDRSYDYWFVLYIMLDDETKEVIKLKFKGTGRGNFINYQKELSKVKLKPYQIITKFFTKKDEQANGKFQVFFSAKQDENGAIKLYEDVQDVYSKRISLYGESKKKLEMLSSPQTQPMQELEQPMQTSEESTYNPNLPPIEAYEEDESEIKISDIPFA